MSDKITRGDPYELWANLDYDKTGCVSLREISEAPSLAVTAAASRRMPGFGSTSRPGVAPTSPARHPA